MHLNSLLAWTGLVILWSGLDMNHNQKIFWLRHACTTAF